MTDKERLGRIESNWKEHGVLGSMNIVWLIEQAEKVEESEKLREVLEFYADKMHYINYHDQYLDELPSEIDFDEGKRARKVLEEMK